MTRKEASAILMRKYRGDKVKQNQLIFADPDPYSADPTNERGSDT
jgi:hypothetical protein